MIRKREIQNNEISNTDNKINTNNDNSNINNQNSKIKTFDDSKRKIFKSYEEEAIYVLKILKEEHGVDIYEEGRYGGMYLNNRKSKIKHIFESNNNNKTDNKKSNDESQINNKDLSNFFKSKNK